MENRQEYEMYDYARHRAKQKKFLFFHFILFVLGSFAMFSINSFVQDTTIAPIWWPYAIGAWSFILFLHIINVTIVNRFMGKEWQDKQVAHLVELQKKKIEELRSKVERDFPLVDVRRDLHQEGGEVKADHDNEDIK
ncbi:2TM domain-containing protein [Myroides pelagicus]|uniref:2TM domain-containing protein n=1 Tax=Myroides pelagicus TaxID=270914 RepID=A0A7K1GP11_9FLAO|nr:2TM domain-containing protein [Myroides pelagicus]MEC4114409.1 2TM domain-containing protein [Myroides pelagicus]MTH30133.1 hypothetical protein [Myroides pelagicus]